MLPSHELDAWNTHKHNYVIIYTHFTVITGTQNYYTESKANKFIDKEKR